MLHKKAKKIVYLISVVVVVVSLFGFSFLDSNWRRYDWDTRYHHHRSRRHPTNTCTCVRIYLSIGFVHFDSIGREMFPNILFFLGATSVHSVHPSIQLHPFSMELQYLSRFVIPSFTKFLALCCIHFLLSAF